MKEYISLNDPTDDLEKVNDAARSGWRVISAQIDSGRGPLFILERDVEADDTLVRELGSTGEVLT